MKLIVCICTIIFQSKVGMICYCFTNLRHYTGSDFGETSSYISCHLIVYL